MFNHKKNIFDLVVIISLLSLLPLFYYSYKTFEIKNKDRIITDLKNETSDLKNEIKRLNATIAQNPKKTAWKMEKSNLKLNKLIKVIFIVNPYVKAVIKEGDCVVDSDDMTPSQIVKIHHVTGRNYQDKSGYQEYEIVVSIAIEVAFIDGEFIRIDGPEGTVKIGGEFHFYTTYYDIVGRVIEIKDV